MKNTATIISFLGLLSLAGFSAMPALAQSATNPDGFQDGFVTVNNEFADDLSTEDPEVVIRNILRSLLTIVSIIAIAALIAGGVMYILALGDEKKAERAKKVILYTIIGLVVIILAGLIVNFVIGITGTE